MPCRKEGYRQGKVLGEKISFFLKNRFEKYLDELTRGKKVAKVRIVLKE
jgi:hypothetical protein